MTRPMHPCDWGNLYKGVENYSGVTLKGVRLHFLLGKMFYVLVEKICNLNFYSF